MGWSKGPTAGVGLDFPRKGWEVSMARERGGEGESHQVAQNLDPQPSQAIERARASVIREVEVQVLSQRETGSDLGFKDSFWHLGSEH